MGGLGRPKIVVQIDKPVLIDGLDFLPPHFVQFPGICRIQVHVLLWRIDGFQPGATSIVEGADYLPVEQETKMLGQVYFTTELADSGCDRPHLLNVPS